MSSKAVLRMLHRSLFQKKVVDFMFYQIPPGTWGDALYLSAQAMKAFIFRKLVRAWIDSESVAFLAHDQDSSVDKVVQEEECDVVQFLDRNHVMKSWDKMWKAAAYPDQRARARQLPYMAEIERSLKRWFYVVLKGDEEDETRVARWRQCVDKHYTSGESTWSGKGNKEAEERLRRFVESMCPHNPQTRSGFTTQLLEPSTR
jgi:hypothetical protein